MCLGPVHFYAWHELSHVSKRRKTERVWFWRMIIVIVYTINIWPRMRILWPEASIHYMLPSVHTVYNTGLLNCTKCNIFQSFNQQLALLIIPDFWFFEFSKVFKHLILYSKMLHCAIDLGRQVINGFKKSLTHHHHHCRQMNSSPMRG